MTPLDPAELSAYLDGELSAERMHEVQRILASDAVARAEFEALAAADADWRASARTAGFDPKVDFSQLTADTISQWVVAMFVVLLIIMQSVVKQLDILALTVALNGLALAVVAIGVVFLIERQLSSAASREPSQASGPN